MFGNMATSGASFLDVVEIDEVVAIHELHYGAPTGFQLAPDRPGRIESSISQDDNTTTRQHVWSIAILGPFKKFWAAAPGSGERRAKPGNRRFQSHFRSHKELIRWR